MNYQPRVFIGSSTQAKPIAHALEKELRGRMQCQLWYEDTFNPSKTTIEDLEQLARSGVDCAVMVFTPDDIRDRGKGGVKTIRDNIIFELGLFMGALGRGRTFGLKCSHCTVDLPTDLSGITWLQFPYPHEVLGVKDPVESLERIGDALKAIPGKIESQLHGLSTEPVRILGSTELVRSYPTRGFVTRPEWNGIIRQAKRNLWLYGMAEHGYAEDDEVPYILRDAFEKGCDIRILLLDPEHALTLSVDREEGHPEGTLSARIQASLSRFLDIRRNIIRDLKIRLYQASPAVSIVRGDDAMLVTPYVRFLTGNNSPTFELRKSQRSGIFGRYETHFEKMWKEAIEVDGSQYGNSED